MGRVDGGFDLRILSSCFSHALLFRLEVFLELIPSFRRSLRFVISLVTRSAWPGSFIQSTDGSWCLSTIIICY